MINAADGSSSFSFSDYEFVQLVTCAFQAHGYDGIQDLGFSLSELSAIEPAVWNLLADTLGFEDSCQFFKSLSLNYLSSTLGQS